MTYNIQKLFSKLAKKATYNAGEVLFDKSSKTKYIYCLLKGAVKFEFKDQSGVEKSFTLDLPYTYFSNYSDISFKELVIFTTQKTSLLKLSYEEVLKLDLDVQQILSEIVCESYQRVLGKSFEQAKVNILNFLQIFKENLSADNLISSKKFTDHFLSYVLENLELSQIAFYEFSKNEYEPILMHAWPHMETSHLSLFAPQYLDLKSYSEELNDRRYIELDPRKFSQKITFLGEGNVFYFLPIYINQKLQYGFWINFSEKVNYQKEAIFELLTTCGYFLETFSHQNEELDPDKIKAQKIHVDQITGLATRILFKDRLGYILKQSERSQKLIAVLYLGIDRFREINTTLGYDTGDQLLKILGQRVKSCIRKTDTLARIHGDEFCILAEIKNVEESKLIANRIISTLEQPIYFREQECYVGISIGIAVSPENGNTVNSLMLSAEKAMYKAKDLTGSTYQVSSDLVNDKQVDRVKTEANLRIAIDNDEIQNFYQPIVDCKTQKIVACETLSRWIKADGTIIPPIDFIPLSEKTGLIVQMSEKMLKKACEANIALSQKYNKNFRMTANVSMRWLIDSRFIPSLEACLEQTKVNPKNIVLELTEGVLLRDTESAKRILDHIKSLGFKIALDDFGTGYSSLSFLDQFEIDYLKIDQSFVRKIEILNAKVPIISGLLKLSQELEIDVVAEGIETKIQHEFLKREACDFGQGYYYGRPMPFEELEKRLVEQQDKVS